MSLFVVSLVNIHTENEKQISAHANNPDFSVQSGKIGTVAYLILYCACEPRQISTQILIKLPACDSTIWELTLKEFPHCIHISKTFIKRRRLILIL